MRWERIDKVKPGPKQRVWYWFEVFEKSYRGYYMTTRYGGDMFYGRGGWLTDDVTYWMPNSRNKPTPPTLRQRRLCLYHPYEKNSK